MSLLHSFYCWGQVLVVLGTTFTLVFIGQKLWFFIPFAWAIVPAITAIFMINMPMPDLSTKAERISPKQLFRTKTFIILLILMLTAGSAELAMSQWSSIFAGKRARHIKSIRRYLRTVSVCGSYGLGSLGLFNFWQKNRYKEISYFLRFFMCDVLSLRRACTCPDYSSRWLRAMRIFNKYDVAGNINNSSTKISRRWNRIIRRLCACRRYWMFNRPLAYRDCRTNIRKQPENAGTWLCYRT